MGIYKGYLSNWNDLIMITNAISNINVPPAKPAIADGVNDTFVSYATGIEIVFIYNSPVIRVSI